jgi:hypothetical protein
MELPEAMDDAVIEARNLVFGKPSEGGVEAIVADSGSEGMNRAGPVGEPGAIRGIEHKDLSLVAPREEFVDHATQTEGGAAVGWVKGVDTVEDFHHSDESMMRW